MLQRRRTQPQVFRLRPPRHATDEDLSAGTPDFGGLRSRWRWLCILALARVADSPILGFMLETRLATLVDAVLITAHRRAMFAEVGLGTPEELETMSRHFTPWLERMMAAGRYAGWIVEEGAVVAASAGFFELDWPPHPFDPAATGRGYLLNFWVEPAYRRCGLARMLVRE